FAFTSSSDVGFGTSGTGGISSFTAVNNGTAPITTTVTVTGTANGCPGPVQVFTITVNPSPVVNAVASLSVCNGAPVSAIAFSSPTPGATFQYASSTNIGFGTSGVGSIPGFTAFNSGSTPITSTISVFASANGCAGPAQSFSITVNPSPTVNSVANVTVCNGQTNPAIAFTSSTPGATFAFTSSSNVGFGTSGTTSIPSFTAVNNGTAPITTTVTVTGTANGCPGPVQVFTITVNPSPVVNAVANQVVCNGAPVSAIAFSSPTPGATFQYASSTNIGFGTSGVGSIPGFTAFNSGSTPITSTISVFASANGCAGPAQSFSITVNPSPTVNSVANVTVCNGQTNPAIAFTSSTPGATFAFTSSSDVGFGTSGTGGIPSFTAVNNGTAPITTTVTVTGTANGCPGPVQVFTITVNPSPVVNAVANQVVCNGAPVSAIAFSSPTPGATFQYASSTNIGFGTSGVGSIPGFTAFNSGSTPI
ncbi:hypothetical protein, partial [Nibrella viscosa]|uniref:hypothetical protein n=1 Tax=Nibrella viscosa TaxID=1084524 RepID=UPI0031E8B5C6